MATPTVVRKRPTRPTMNKKSPYKAGKSSAKAKKYSTKKLSSVKAIVKMKSPTKQEKMLARQRAHKWAKKELGKKKSSSSSLFIDVMAALLELVP